MLYPMTLPAYKDQCRLILKNYTIRALRVYARYIGVRAGTEQKKDPLIEEIVAIRSGERLPAEPSKRGAPAKEENKKPDPNLVKEMDELQERYWKTVHGESTPFDFQKEYRNMLDENTEFVFNDPQNEKGNETDEEFEGQYETISEIPCLLPLSGNWKQQQKIVIPNEIIEKYALVEGDVLICFARKQEGIYAVTGVSFINGIDVSIFERAHFEQAKTSDPVIPISFDGKWDRADITTKALHWLLTVRRGQRGLVIGEPKSGKSSLLYNMSMSAMNNNTDVWLFILLLDQSPETVVQFRKDFPHVNFMYTTYEDDCDAQIFAAEFLLKRAKRFAECGKDVLFIVDSFNALARAYNESERSLGGKTHACGLEYKTVYYLKNFLGSARRLEKKGSLTMIGSFATGTGNPMDDILLPEMKTISKLEIALSGDLAKKRIFPNFDLANTRSVDTRFPDAEDDSLFLPDFLRREYLPHYSMEDLALLLSGSKSYEEAYRKAWKAVKGVEKE